MKKFRTLITYEELLYLYKHNLTDFNYVIIDGRIKQWVGKTFVDIDQAFEADYFSFPIIVD